MRRVVAAVVLTLLIAARVVSCAPFVLGSDRYQQLESTGRFDGTVARFVSGDAGIRFGMGRPVTQALAARGIRVVAIAHPPPLQTPHRQRTATVRLPVTAPG